MRVGTYLTKGAEAMEKDLTFTATDDRDSKRTKNVESGGFERISGGARHREGPFDQWSL